MGQTATFRNKKTGEVKDFTLEEATAIGIPQEKFLTKLQTQQEIEQIETGEVPDPLVPQKRVARQALGILKTRFGRGESENIGTKKDLSLAEKGGFFSRGAGKAKVVASGLVAGKLQQDINIYKKDFDTFRGVFTQAFGSGTPQEAEAIALTEAAPSAGTTDAEAIAWFEDVNRLLGGISEKNEAQQAVDQAMGKKKIDETAPSPEERAIAETVETQPLTPVQRIAQKVAGATPVVGGVVGGLTGAALGGGVASLFTGALGTAAGVGAGIAFSETIQDLVGIQDETPEEQLKKGAVTTATAAGLDLMGGALFMGGGIVIKQLGKGIFKIGDDIALRAIRPSPSQQRKFLQKTGIEMKDFAIDKGLFSKGVEQVDTLIKPLQSSFDDIAVKSDRVVQLEDVVAKFDDQIKGFGDLPNTEAKRLASQLTKEKKLLINKVAGEKEFQIFLPSGEPSKVAPTGSIGAGELTTIRKKVDKLISEAKFMQDPISAGKNRAVRNIYQESVQDATEGLTDNAGRNLKGIGQELNKLYAFREVADKQAGLGKGTLPVGLIKSITTATGAGAGFAAEGDIGGAMKGALLGLGLPALANNPKVISYLARNLPIVGKAVQALPENQKAKIVTAAFRRLLTNLGAVSLSQLGAD